MLRSLASVCRSTYTCLCLQPRSTAIRTPLAKSIIPVLRNIHQSASVQVLYKDLKGKKSQVAEYQEEKFEQVADAGDVDVEGLYQAGFMTPTWETQEMVVDGVKYNELPIVYIQSTLNNTIITITSHNNKEILLSSSCGREGFRNAKKSTSVAAQATGLSVGSKAVKRGLRSVRVAIKGLGVGREAALTGLKMGGLNIVSLTDRTQIRMGGPKPRKQRRL